MKKPTIEEQIKEAQKIVRSWSKEKRDSVRLEGRDIEQEKFQQKLKDFKEFEKFIKSLKKHKV